MLQAYPSSLLAGDSAHVNLVIEVGEILHLNRTSPSCEPVVVLHPATAQLRQRWGASLANGSTNCIGKAAGKGSESGTGVIAPVKLETENMLRESGWWEDCTHRFLVRLTNLFFSAFGLTGGCKTSSPTAYPNVSSTALGDLSHGMTIVPDQRFSHPSLHPKSLGTIP